ncbi:ATP-dependent DNA helicase PIF1 [Striga asiatica]|uniref:ATP-dependent DNA helicase PIF1 n=1 Tax=Striga asiatica TaxID=4170 RepID=A0A5A7R3R8_STRAF|nr:ATP-dependent DNA helicase PIF1 [Striga asiatica]
MTINKAQGHTLDVVGIYLKEPVFSHGQLYVALSRARAAANVKMLISYAFFSKVSVKCTKNIVYKEVLEMTKTNQSNFSSLKKSRCRGSLSKIKEVDNKTSAWTAIVQVVEKNHIQRSKPPKNVSYRRHLLTDSDGTKLSAVVYSADLPLVWCLTSGIMSPMQLSVQLIYYIKKRTMLFTLWNEFEENEGDYNIVKLYLKDEIHGEARQRARMDKQVAAEEHL